MGGSCRRPQNWGRLTKLEVGQLTSLRQTGAHETEGKIWQDSGEIGTALWVRVLNSHERQELRMQVAELHIPLYTSEYRCSRSVGQGVRSRFGKDVPLFCKVNILSSVSCRELRK